MVDTLQAWSVCDMIGGDAAGICGILGSTYTGEYEDIEKLDQLVEKVNKEKVSPLHCCSLLGWLGCFEDARGHCHPFCVHVYMAWSTLNDWLLYPLCSLCIFVPVKVLLWIAASVVCMLRTMVGVK